jgi:hypothetical protein
MQSEHFLGVTNRPVAGLSIAIAFVMTLTACDPGFYYRPEGWKHMEEGRWSAAIDGLDLETRGFGGLSRSPGWSVEFTVRNNSPRQVTIRRAVIKSEQGEFPSMPVTPENLGWYVVEPLQEKRITLSFRIGRPLAKVVRGSVLTLEIETDSTTRSIPIRLVKE